MVAAVLRLVLPRDRREEILADLMDSHRDRLGRLDQTTARRLLWREAASLVAWRAKALLTGSGRSRRGSHRGASLRETTGPAVAQDLGQDLRFAVRSLARRPAFSLMAIAVMALGIGAPTTMFSLVDAAFLQDPEHVAEPDRLVRLHGVGGLEREVRYMGRAEVVHYAEGASALSGLAAYGGPSPVPYARAGRGVGQLDLGFVSHDYFDVLGTRMALGRDFLPEEEQAPGVHAVIVLSHGFWSRELGSDRGVVGGSLRIDDTPYTVVGVAPEGFAGVSWAEPDPDAWAPIAMYGTVARVPHMAWWEFVAGLDVTWLQAVGRLSPGATVDAAQAQLSARAESVPREAGAPEAGVLVSTSVLYQPAQEATLARLTWLFLGAVALVLVVAVANAALLLLSWTSTRSRELGIRAALGAGRVRMVRQVLVESLVLAAAGGALGVLVAFPLSGLAGDLLPFHLSASFQPGWAALAGGVVLTVLTALLAGLAPALGVSRVDPARALRSGRSGPLGARLRTALVVAQVALSVTLVSGAFLFGASALTARGQPLGFESANRLAVLVDFRARDYGAEEGRAFVDQALERLRGLPRVRAATAAYGIPFRGRWSTELPAAPGAHEGSGTFRLSLNMVSSDYFRVWGIPLVEGRALGPEDRGGGPLSIVVNETFAERYWPGQDPVGRVIERQSDRWQVVGIARDAVYRELGGETEPRAYLSLDQRWMPQTHFVIHTETDAGALAPDVRGALRELDPGLTFPWVGTMDAVLTEETARYDASAILVGLFALTALTLAAAGLYALLSFLVAHRTREIGIRIALGAGVGDVTTRMLGSLGRLVALGIGLGLGGFLLLRSFAESMVFGISTGSPVPPVLAALTLTLVGVLAAWGPTRRATRVDPLEAIREE